MGCRPRCDGGPELFGALDHGWCALGMWRGWSFGTLGLSWRFLGSFSAVQRRALPRESYRAFACAASPRDSDLTTRFGGAPNVRWLISVYPHFKSGAHLCGSECGKFVVRVAIIAPPSPSASPARAPPCAARRAGVGDEGTQGHESRTARPPEGDSECVTCGCERGPSFF